MIPLFDWLIHSFKVLIHPSSSKPPFDNLKKYYKIRDKAFDGLSWIDYMNKLLEPNETGSKLKEVISREIQTASSALKGNLQLKKIQIHYLILLRLLAC